MTRHVFIFLGTFVAGALIALVARAALFHPHAEHEGHPAAGGDYAPMVSNELAPAKPASAPAPKHDAPTQPAQQPAAQPADEHKGHGGHGTESASVAADEPVNTVCAICGMPVDPKVPTAKYQGKTIGFGCKMCPPKFAKDPDRWGPLYLKNETAKR